MKNTILLLCFSITALGSVAQPKTTSSGSIYFDGSDWSDGFMRLYRDTASNPACIWQIGKPQKTVFTAALGHDDVIVTDTVAPYRTNDTSAFVIKMSDLAVGWSNLPHPPYGIPFIQAHYNVDTDSLVDYGTISISVDMGNSWVDVLEDTSYGFFDTYGIRPVLTGYSNGWQIFRVNFVQYAESLNLTPYDTVMLRFRFISDTLETGRDGLMFDDFQVMDWWEGVADLSVSPVCIYPNPAASAIRVRCSEAGTLLINDLVGKTQLSINMAKAKETDLDLSAFPGGLYTYIYRTGKGLFSGKLTILR